MCVGRARLLAVLRPDQGGLLWRTAKADVAHELGLPPQHQHTSSLRFSAIEQHFYSRQHAECSLRASSTISSQLLSQAADGLAGQRRLTAAEEKKLLFPLLRLRQACCHPQVCFCLFCRCCCHHRLGSCELCCSVPAALTYETWHAECTHCIADGRTFQECGALHAHAGSVTCTLLTCCLSRPQPSLQQALCTRHICVSCHCYSWLGLLLGSVLTRCGGVPGGCRGDQVASSSQRTDEPGRDPRCAGE